MHKKEESYLVILKIIKYSPMLKYFSTWRLKYWKYKHCNELFGLIESFHKKLNFLKSKFLYKFLKKY